MLWTRIRISSLACNGLEMHVSHPVYVPTCARQTIYCSAVDYCLMSKILAGAGVAC